MVTMITPPHADRAPGRSLLLERQQPAVCDLRPAARQQRDAVTGEQEMPAELARIAWTGCPDSPLIWLSISTPGRIPFKFDWAAYGVEVHGWIYSCMFAYGQIHSGTMHTIVVRLSSPFTTIVSIAITMVLGRYVVVVASAEIPEVSTAQSETAKCCRA